MKYNKVFDLIFKYYQLGNAFKFCLLIFFSIFYFLIHLKLIVKYYYNYINNRKNKIHTIIFSISSKMEIQFIEKLILSLKNKSNVELVFISGTRTLKIEDMCEINNFKQYPYGVLPFMKAELFISTKSSLLWHKPFKTKKIHVFHSHVSIHQVYSLGSFEDYDIFFAVGPHHKKELKEYLPKRGKINFNIVEVGSEKIDNIINSLSPEIIVSPNIKSILLAPTWGENSFLPYVPEITKILIDKNYLVIFQPHPSSLITDISIVNKICNEFKNSPNFFYSKKHTITDYLKVDLLVSDWSGIAFEFSLGYLKPVIFFNTKQKVLNPYWKYYFQSKGIEYSYRYKIGLVISNSLDVIKSIENIEKENYYKKIKGIRDELLYNPGKSNIIASSFINNYLNN